MCWGLNAVKQLCSSYTKSTFFGILSYIYSSVFYAFPCHYSACYWDEIHLSLLVSSNNLLSLYNSQPCIYAPPNCLPTDDALIFFTYEGIPNRSPDIGSCKFSPVYLLSLNEAYHRGAGVHSIELLAMARVPWSYNLCMGGTRNQHNPMEDRSSQLLNSQKSTHQKNLARQIQV